MSKKLNVAILGAGNIARSMATALQGLPEDMTMYAVASRSLEKATAFKEKWGFERAYGSYEELAADENVDLVYVATPHSEHFKNAKLMIEHGKACLVEKAFCGNRKQAEELINLAKEKNVFLAEAMWTHYTPARDVIEQLIREEIGKITYIEADFSDRISHVPRISQPSLAGGALLDVGIYPLTVAAMYMKDEIESVDVKCELSDLGIDAWNEVTLHYRGGATAKVMSNAFDRVANYARIEGVNGTICYEFIQAPTEIHVYDNAGNEIEVVEVPHMVNGYEYELLECKAMIEAGKLEPESMPWSETLRIMGWMDQIRSKMGVVYPFETAEDIAHDDVDIWNA